MVTADKFVVCHKLIQFDFDLIISFLQKKFNHLTMNIFSDIVILNDRNIVYYA